MRNTKSLRRFARMQDTFLRRKCVPESTPLLELKYSVFMLFLMKNGGYGRVHSRDRFKPYSKYTAFNRKKFAAT